MQKRAPTFSEFLKSPPSQKAASYVAYLTAFGCLADGLTTAIGLSLGGHETVAMSIAIMNAFGTAGFVIVKDVQAVVMVSLGLVFEHYWARFRPIACFAILVVIGVSAVLFTYPALHNVAVLLHLWGVI